VYKYEKSLTISKVMIIQNSDQKFKIRKQDSKLNSRRVESTQQILEECHTQAVNSWGEGRGEGVFQGFRVLGNWVDGIIHLENRGRLIEENIVLSLGLLKFENL
jgi:hypothetical protein